MLERSTWKRMQELDGQLPIGHRGECNCKRLVVLEVPGRADPVLHHPMPWCLAFERFMRSRKRALP